jgi:hypothetical protein
MTEEKRKPGRPKSGNPFHPQQEAEHLSWDHGFNAQSTDDCPYDSRDPEARSAYSAWMQGFKANKNRPKPVKNTAVESINETPEAEVEPEVAEEGSGVVSLQSLSTAELEAELKKRKIKDLEQLLQQENKLLKVLEEVRAKVAKLKVLMGD